MNEFERVVPDTSVLIERALSKQLTEQLLSVERILIPYPALSELESQANAGKETGFIGLEEISTLRGLVDTEIVGSAPSPASIKHAREGSMDALIRQIAYEEGATLVTADYVQAQVARAQGIPVHFVEFSYSREDPLVEFFVEGAMSVHIKEDAQTIRKIGRPGEWVFEKLETVPSGSQVETLAKRILEAAQQRKDSFIEIERSGSSIVQLGRYRIVIARPPFASRWEITAVRPVKQLSLDEYEFPEKFRNRLSSRAEGILVAGSPGEGKSTFTQALGTFYSQQEKIVKTVEAPRDLVLPDEITQYSASNGSPEEIRDVLLLNRPDYTIYDEIRNNQDFTLYADMRMAGIGMIGVLHASNPVDAVQRFLGRIELGIVPHVVDTIVFIKAGKIDTVLSLQMVVKVPAGMTEEDLSRPVVLVNDFFADKPLYEIYTYGDQTVVIPISEVAVSQKKNMVLELAESGVREHLRQYNDDIEVELVSDKKAIIYVPKKAIPSIIGKGGENIRHLEDELGLRLDVQELTGKQKKKGAVEYKVRSTKANLTLFLSANYANKEIDLYDDDAFILAATTSKKAEISISLKSSLGRLVKDAAEKRRLVIVT